MNIRHVFYALSALFLFSTGKSFASSSALQRDAQVDPLDAAQELPLEINAENGIVCEREKNICTASGNVVASHGDYVLNCDTLIAYFREGKDRKTELWQVEAKGNVVIHSTKAHHVAYAQHGLYTLDDERALLTGRNLKLEVDDLIVTARDALEYSKSKNIAFAKGEAVAVKENRLIKGETLKAYFAPNQQGKHDIQRIEAFKNVLISTDTEVATGDYGDYLKDKEFATLEGNVKITRQDGQIEGQYAEVKLDKGISKVFNQSPVSSTRSRKSNQRVHVLILPRQKKAA